MKKKIKDLTFFDLSEICSKLIDCRKCPLRIIRVGGYAKECIILHIIDSKFQPYWKEVIEREVEI